MDLVSGKLYTLRKNANIWVYEITEENFSVFLADEDFFSTAHPNHQEPIMLYTGLTASHPKKKDKQYFGFLCKEQLIYVNESDLKSLKLLPKRNANNGA